MKDTLHFIVSSIVEKTDAVAIDEIEENGVINLVIHVDPTEIGKVIGKEGKVIRSIRNLMKVKAMKHDVRIMVSLAEIPQE
ncbi:MAG: KH domain-containing protein [Patescibacteria group bacterium]